MHCILDHTPKAPLAQPTHPRLTPKAHMRGSKVPQAVLATLQLQARQHIPQIQQICQILLIFPSRSMEPLKLKTQMISGETVRGNMATALATFANLSMQS